MDYWVNEWMTLFKRPHSRISKQKMPVLAIIAILFLPVGTNNVLADLNDVVDFLTDLVEPCLGGPILLVSIGPIKHFSSIDSAFTHLCICNVKTVSRVG